MLLVLRAQACVDWAGDLCLSPDGSGFSYGVETALLVASCPEACADVTPDCSTAAASPAAAAKGNGAAAAKGNGAAACKDDPTYSEGGWTCTDCS